MSWYVGEGSFGQLLTGPGLLVLGATLYVALFRGEHSVVGRLLRKEKDQRKASEKARMAASFSGRPRELQLGATGRLTWSFTRWPQRVLAVCADLEGAELSTTVSTSEKRDHSSSRLRTTTHRHYITTEKIFFETPLYRAGESGVARSGEINLSIPSTLMPSSKADLEEILWRVRFRAEVRLGPDIDLDFPIEVLPAASAE